MEHQSRELRTLYEKYLDNRLSGEEIKELFDVLGNTSDEELRPMLSEFLKTGNDSPAVGEEFVTNKILKNIHSLHFARKKMLLWHNVTFKRVAAAVLLISGLGLWWYNAYYLQPSATIEIAVGSIDLKPGNDHAVLTLSDGSNIDLSTVSENTDILSQEGVVIEKEASGDLVYRLPDQAVELGPAKYNTISTPRGGRFKIILPDSTAVWLNASSSLTYPISFAKADVRKVKLQGEAYFEVTKYADKGAKIPFMVTTDRQEIEVLGTKFNVNAYLDEPNPKTTLVEGAVRLNEMVVLKPGQQGVGSGTNIEVKAVDAKEAIDWKSGEFSLKNNDFRAIMRKIARWYDVEVVYDESAPKHLELGGWISREKNISSILNLIQSTGNVHFKLEGRRVTVSK
ncbi:fec operon regulator FecR [compost metagenome]